MKGRMNFLGLFLVFLIVLSGSFNCNCRYIDDGEDEKYGLTRMIGTIKSLSGSPIAGAEIVLEVDNFSPLNANSDSNGNFVIDVQVCLGSPLNGTQSEAMVSKSGYKTYLTTFNHLLLEIGRQYNIIITLAETDSAEEGSWVLGPGNVSISGSVRSSEGPMIEEAIITLRAYTGKLLIETESDSAGNFSDDAGTFGICQPLTGCFLSVSKPGFVTKTVKNLTINPGENSFGETMLTACNIHLFGTVKSPGGQPIGSAQVLLYAVGAPVVGGTFTDKNGDFYLSVYSDKKIYCKFSITRLGYEKYVTYMYVSPNETYDLGTITLDPI